MIVSCNETKSINTLRLKTKRKKKYIYFFFFKLELLKVCKIHLILNTLKYLHNRSIYCLCMYMNCIYTMN